MKLKSFSTSIFIYPVILTSLMLCYSQSSAQSNDSWELEASLNEQSGLSSRLDWSYKNYDHRYNFSRSVDIKNKGYFFGARLRKGRFLCIGMRMEYQPGYTDKDLGYFSLKSKKYNALVNYTSQFPLFGWVSLMGRLNVGYSRFTSTETNRLFIGYSTPHQYETKWNGVLFNLELGADIRLWSTGFVVEPYLEIRLSAYNLDKAFINLSSILNLRS